jgi:hypothetical protein
MEQQIMELAQRYGIQINDVASEHGGLFNINPSGEKEAITDVFFEEDVIKNQEQVSFRDCNKYIVYSENSLLVSAA